MKRKPTLPGTEPPQRKKLGQRLTHTMVHEIAGLIRLSFEAGEITSVFGLEGPLRAGLRSDMCRNGWSWAEADAMARELLDSAFQQVRATRPSWSEGQPDWAVSTGAMIERSICARCGKPLPEGKFKFCCNFCAKAHNAMVCRFRNAAENNAYDKVVHFYGRKGSAS
ncbi:hypothetical protein E2977_07190 [Paracoccus yeei]|uniref:hypothetical protein n=2 Tax=Paracoccus yeei TaxID=147645 RepID=UPI001C8EB8B7|nr:hypothetical protein [Paracoccus yeei]MBY0138172.1 hypothetical protein [Paracoccus yeei]